jgi:hypothetical protein
MVPIESNSQPYNLGAQSIQFINIMTKKIQETALMMCETIVTQCTNTVLNTLTADNLTLPLGSKNLISSFM